MRWRWDQGRLDYFGFDMIKKIAKALCALENADLRAAQDPLRAQLMLATGLPFAPEDYKVWRNYKRVFGCCMLAADVDGRMICTELCHKLATEIPNDMVADEYFSHFARGFYYPSPVFQGYANRGNQTFPVSAILKFLLAKARNGQQPVVTVEEVANILVANNCTGAESVGHYGGLMPRHYMPAVDEMRQIRELIRFISQISFLKWIEPQLFLDIDPGNVEALSFVETFAHPLVSRRKPDAARELLHLGATGGLSVIPLLRTPAAEADISFSEGKPKRVSHLRYERSPKLREMFFRDKNAPFVCDMCALNVSQRYQWTENLLELHHLLPLASPLRVEAQRTSLSQLVAICPSCHKAAHIFYKNWLDDNDQDDFLSYEEAGEVYELAKQSTANGN